MSRQISTWSHENRSAELYLNLDEEFYAYFFIDGKFIETREFPNKALRYCEDACENFVMSYGEWAK